MPDFCNRTAFHPLSIRGCRDELAKSGETGVLQRLARMVSSSNHNTVIAADFHQTSTGGPLQGIPIGVKDNVDVAGFATTGGSFALRGNQPTGDATAVARLRHAGALFPCKLNMHELAFGVTTDNLGFGRVFNPFDTSRTAGGSSGGSAAAVARGFFPIALGTDTGGSVRIPASFCGVFGFRPSTGRYPGDGVLNLSLTRDTIGIIATNVADIAEIDAHIAGEQAPLPPPVTRPLRLGLAADALPGLSRAVEDVFRAALATLTERGQIDVVPLPALNHAALEQEIGLPVVFSESLEIWRAFCTRHLNCDLESFTEKISDPLVRKAFADMTALESTYTQQYAARIQQILADLRERTAALYSRYGIDMLVAPTSAVQPPKWGEAENLLLDGSYHPTFFTVVRNTTLASLTGSPSLSIPVGMDCDGLPVGLMLDGPVGSDRDMLGWADYLVSALE